MAGNSKAARHFFAVKNLPFVDIPARGVLLVYTCIVNKNPELQEVVHMRHFYFRLILGIVFIGCMIYSFVTMNIPFALLYLFLSGMLLASAYSLRKKDKDHRR